MMIATPKTSAKGAAAIISRASLKHNIASAREGVQMATRAKDAESAIAAAEHVVDAVARIMGVAPNTLKGGIKTLQRAAAATTATEELVEIVYTAKLIAAVTYSAAAEAMAAEAAAATEAAPKASLRRRNGYTRLECRGESKH